MIESSQVATRALARVVGAGVAPDAGEGLLGDLLGDRGLADDRQGEPVDAPLKAAHERGRAARVTRRETGEQCLVGRYPRPFLRLRRQVGLRADHQSRDRAGRSSCGGGSRTRHIQGQEFRRSRASPDPRRRLQPGPRHRAGSRGGSDDSTSSASPADERLAQRHSGFRRDDGRDRGGRQHRFEQQRRRRIRLLGGGGRLAALDGLPERSRRSRRSARRSEDLGKPRASSAPGCRSPDRPHSHHDVVRPCSESSWTTRHPASYGRREDREPDGVGVSSWITVWRSAPAYRQSRRSPPFPRHAERGDDLRSAVVAVQSGLGDDDPDFSGGVGRRSS